MYLNLILSKSTFKISYSYIQVSSLSENIMAPSYKLQPCTVVDKYSNIPGSRVWVLFATRSTSAQLDTDLEAELGSLPSFLHVFVGNVERTTSTVTILKGSLGHIHTGWLIGCLVIHSEPFFCGLCKCHCGYEGFADFRVLWFG